MPYYDSKATVGRALQSVDRQSLQPLEIIIVDNEGDETLAMYLPRVGPELQIIGEPRRGAAYARNAGMTRARGRFVAFLDCDDEWTPDYLFEMTRAINKVPHALLYAGGSLVKTSRGTRYSRAPRLEGRSIDALVHHNDIATSAAVVQANAARESGGFLEGLSLPSSCEDWALWLRLLRRGSAVGVPKALVLRHEGGTGPRRYGSELLYLDMEKTIDAVLGDQYPRIQRVFRAAILLRRGTFLLAQGKRIEARARFIQAVKLWPRSPRAWAWLGLASAPTWVERAVRNIQAVMVRRRGP